MIKAKFRDHVRSKTNVEMINQVLCKIVCHSICCLIRETRELGIVPEFGPLRAQKKFKKRLAIPAVKEWALYLVAVPAMMDARGEL